jgi:G:T-mismatch repair DNA endonuclease (very short patch repair protein)
MHTFYEFFAGGGMARAGLGPQWKCLFANDINNRDYWTVKIARNKTRDAKHLVALEVSGWRALTLWECELHENNLQERIVGFLDN